LELVFRENITMKCCICRPNVPLLMLISSTNL